MSPTVSKVMVMLVALIHAGIAFVELFFWKEPWAHERLNQLLTSSDVAIKAAPIVANAGLYNGFIAAGLVWGLRAREGNARIQAFFLVCVVIAGIVGAITLKDWVPLALQAIPAGVTLLAIRKSVA
jgi:putative membrane protein